MSTPTQKERIRTAMSAYCAAAESWEERWHYTQARPYTGLGIPPSELHANDCSGYIALAYYHASYQAGVFLRDPLGYAYSGWGYTGSLITWLKENGTEAPVGRYLVGDIALYGSSSSTTKHTTVCRRKGNRDTSVWSSFGAERGPVAASLNYRTDLLGVWRHPGLK